MIGVFHFMVSDLNANTDKHPFTFLNLEYLEELLNTARDSCSWIKRVKGQKQRA